MMEETESEGLSEENDGVSKFFFWQFGKWIFFVVLVYLAIIACLICFPKSQGLILYGHIVRRPFFKKLSDLKAFGIQHHARNIKILTEDGVTLGAWHLLPSNSPAVVQASAALLHQELLGTCRNGHDLQKVGASCSRSELDNVGQPPPFASREEIFESALGTEHQKVVIFFHGQAATRGAPTRVDLIRFLANHAGVHVISFDYRGFGDSSGWPSEEGVARDALAVWHWVETRAHPTAKVYLYGQSLGTHVATRLAYDLQESGSQRQPQTLFLDAPFRNMRTAASHHPSTLVLRPIPFIRNLLLDNIQEKWATDELLVRIKSVPVVIFHGTDDRMMPFSVGESLYDLIKHQNEIRRTNTETDINSARNEVFFYPIAGAGHKNICSFQEWLVLLLQFVT